MAIEIPNLDDLSYQQLVDELVRSIPQYSSDWTDFNPSDPGITLLELLSWVSESLLYRANTITDLSYYNYLKLIVGEQSYPPEDKYHTVLLDAVENWPIPQTEEGIADVASKVQAYWTSSNRAIAEVDYMALSVDAYYTEEARQKGVLPDNSINYRQLDLDHLQQLRRIFIDADVQVCSAETVKRIDIIVNTAPDISYTENDFGPPAQQDNQDFQLNVPQMLMAIKNFIVPRRALGTLLQVRQVHYTNIDLMVHIKFSSSSRSELVISAIKRKINQYVSPFYGGRNNNGWPLGDPLVSFDLIRLIGEVDGVEMVDRVLLHSYKPVPTSPGQSSDQQKSVEIVDNKKEMQKLVKVVRAEDIQNPAFSSVIVKELIGTVNTEVVALALNSQSDLQSNNHQTGDGL
ncbi:hypothetical protein BTA51_09365 [Hahella sp. CCB-MM4]|uniref:hypothetical protein n=1 Tax=Hahella sp. (strain CCB-MM4) TaxID=1926491 RepID=UPI000B9B4C0E|nr:hypothetical protein [Hahella sp. CCB-MM4]OZG73978.1 hypothetical protein BTA51_09365 [Hahella sp. CCB-MM4]